MAARLSKVLEIIVSHSVAAVAWVGAGKLVALVIGKGGDDPGSAAMSVAASSYNLLGFILLLYSALRRLVEEITR